MKRSCCSRGEEGLFLPTTPVEDGKPPGTVVRVSADAPSAWDDRTLRVHFVVVRGQLEAGQVGSVKFGTRARTALVVRASAILQSAEGPYVFVVSEDRRTMIRRPIQVGNVLYGYAAVTAGLLREGENVAAKYTDSLASELRQKGQVGAVIQRAVGWSARHPAAILLLTLLLAIGASLTQRQLPRDAIPDLSDPQIVLSVDWMGHAATEVASEITRPLTAALQGVPGSQRRARLVHVPHVVHRRGLR